jgi:hypothetical protein
MMGAIPSFDTQVTLCQSSRQRDVQEHLNLHHFRCDIFTQISHHRNLLLAYRLTDWQGEFCRNVIARKM